MKGGKGSREDEKRRREKVGGAIIFQSSPSFAMRSKRELCEREPDEFDYGPDVGAMPCLYCEKSQRMTRFDVILTSKLFYCNRCARSRKPFATLAAWADKLQESHATSHVASNIRIMIQIQENHDISRCEELLWWQNENKIVQTTPRSWEKYKSSGNSLSSSWPPLLPLASFDMSDYKSEILENERDANTGWNSVHGAVWMGNEELLHYLLLKGNSPLDKTRDEGWTALDLAKRVVHHPLGPQFEMLLHFFTLLHQVGVPVINQTWKKIWRKGEDMRRIRQKVREAMNLTQSLASLSLPLPLGHCKQVKEREQDKSKDKNKDKQRDHKEWAWGLQHNEQPDLAREFQRWIARCTEVDGDFPFQSQKKRRERKSELEKSQTRPIPSTEVFIHKLTSIDRGKFVSLSKRQARFWVKSRLNSSRGLKRAEDLKGEEEGKEERR